MRYYLLYTLRVEYKNTSYLSVFKKVFEKNLGKVQQGRRMELWSPIRDFPRYSVSDHGQVRNDRTDRIMSQYKTGGSLLQVGLVHAGKQYGRSVAKLVAESFLKHPSQNFSLPTPINLDGDKENCRASNLMWRPRWFALKYTQQFDVPWENIGPVRNRQTGVVYTDVWDELITIHGLLFAEIIRSITNETYVFPTFESFEWA